MAVVDTELTVYQIIALQNFHYACKAMVINLMHFFSGSTVREYSFVGVITALYMHCVLYYAPHTFIIPWKASLDVLFLRYAGWEGVTATLVSGVIGAGLLCLIVQKAKRCLDFTTTLFIINLVACSLYGGIPMSWEWWVSNLCAAVTMVVGGEYLCSIYELRELPLFRYSSAMQSLNNVFNTPIGSPRGNAEQRV